MPGKESHQPQNTNININRTRKTANGSHSVERKQIQMIAKQQRHQNELEGDFDDSITTGKSQHSVPAVEQLQEHRRN